MKKTEIVIIIGLLALIAIATTTVVVAIPQIPESYWGNATLDDAPAANGTSITVEVYGTGEVVGNTTVNTSSGGYTLSVLISNESIPDDNHALNGDNLTWKIDGINCSVPAPGTDTAVIEGINSNFNISAYHCGLELSAHPTQRSVKEDEDANYTITIKNTGKTVDTFNLTVINTSGIPDRASLSINAVSLSAGESDDVILTINGSAGTYVTTVTGTSTNDTSKNASVTVITDVSAEEVYGVSMSSNVSSASVEKNENAVYNITIENTGNQLDTFDLTLFSESGINASLSDTSVVLDSGKTGNVILTVNGSTTGDYTTRVTASSQNSSKTKTITMSTTILSAISLSVAPQSLAITTGGENVTYTLTLNNTGNIQHIYNLSASEPANANSTLNQTTVTLNPGESTSIELNVSSGTSGTYTVQVVVNTTSAGGVLEEASIATTTTVNPAAVYGVSLSVSPTSRSVDAGVNATYTLTVQNAGNLDDTLNLTLINPRADFATLTKSITSELDPGGSETILLNVSDSEGGSYEVKVIAESQHDPGKQDSVTTTTNVLSYGVVITSDSTSKTAYAGNLSTYTLTIENTGNTEDTYDLTLSNESWLDLASISTDSISLASGASEEVTLNVKDSESGTTYWAVVTATSQGNPNKNDSVNVTTTFVDAPRYGVDTFISPASKEVEKNEDAVYIVSVTNTGNREDTYDITTTIGALGASSLTIPAGDTASTTLTVNGTGIKTYTAVVTATSQSDPTKTKTTSVSTTVVPAVSIKAVPSSASLYLGNESTFTLTIKNTGTMSHTYDLSVTNTSDTAYLSTNSISLSKGDSADITLTMNDSAVGMYTATVTATDKTDTSKKVSVTVSTLYLEAPVYGVDLRVDEKTKTIEPGKYALYVLTVKNLGNNQDTFELNITNNETTATLTKDNVLLQPSGTVGDTATVKLNVSSATVGEYKVNVKAVSQAESSVLDTVETTTKVAGTAGTNNIVNSKIDETSAIKDSTITRSTIVRSLIDSSTITDSEITDSTTHSSTVTDTVLDDVTLENAVVHNGTIYSGNITISGTVYTITSEIVIADIMAASDKKESSIAGAESDTTVVKSEKTNSQLTISNKDNYVGGTITIQKSKVNKSGVEGQAGNLGGIYISIDASDNIDASLDWVIINVTYDQSEIPDDIDESTVRLHQYNESTREWIRLEGAGVPSWCYGAGVDTDANYVWANVSHFSEYGKGGNPYPSPPPPPPPVAVPEYNRIGLLVLIGILSVVLATIVLRRKE